jgi:hypothetical protein
MVLQMDSIVENLTSAVGESPQFPEPDAVQTVLVPVDGGWQDIHDR